MIYKKYTETYNRTFIYFLCLFYNVYRSNFIVPLKSEHSDVLLFIIVLNIAFFIIFPETTRLLLGVNI